MYRDDSRPAGGDRARKDDEGRGPEQPRGVAGDHDLLLEELPLLEIRLPHRRAAPGRGCGAVGADRLTIRRHHSRGGGSAVLATVQDVSGDQVWDVVERHWPIAHASLRRDHLDHFLLGFRSEDGPGS